MPNSTPPMKVQPTRVDSGIEVESPTEVKSAVQVESLHMVAEDPAAEDTAAEKQIASTASEPTVVESTAEEPVTEAKVNSQEPVLNEPAVEAKLAFEETPEEFKKAVDGLVEEETVANEPVEEDQIFDAMDKPATGNETAVNAESTRKNPLSDVRHVMEDLSAEEPVNGESVAENSVAEEPVATTRIEKELHVDIKPATKEHTRVDSGIDIETTKEPLGKLETVVEAKPATEFEPRLEGGMA